MQKRKGFYKNIALNTIFQKARLSEREYICCWRKKNKGFRPSPQEISETLNHHHRSEAKSIIASLR